MTGGIPRHLTGHVNLNGCRVRRENGTIFVQLPRAAWKPTGCGCCCEYCSADGKNNPEAYWDTLVLAETVDVLSGPSSDNTSLFTVHEGLRVRVRNRREGWVQILLPGAAGWRQGFAPVHCCLLRLRPTVWRSCCRDDRL